MMAFLVGWRPLPSRAAETRPEAPDTKGVVEVETEGWVGGSVRTAEEIASIVDDGATRRVLPVVGKSAQQNLIDLARLRGVDMAILPADVLDTARQQGGVPGAEGPFTYVTRLGNRELHILARPDIKSVSDLANQKVNFDVRGSATATTMRCTAGGVGTAVRARLSRSARARSPCWTAARIMVLLTGWPSTVTAGTSVKVNPYL